MPDPTDIALDAIPLDKIVAAYQRRAKDPQKFDLTEIPDENLIRELLGRYECAVMLAVYRDDEGNRRSKLRQHGDKDVLANSLRSACCYLDSENLKRWGESERWS